MKLFYMCAALAAFVCAGAFAATPDATGHYAYSVTVKQTLPDGNTTVDTQTVPLLDVASDDKQTQHVTYGPARAASIKQLGYALCLPNNSLKSEVANIGFDVIARMSPDGKVTFQVYAGTWAPDAIGKKGCFTQSPVLADSRTLGPVSMDPGATIGVKLNNGYEFSIKRTEVQRLTVH